MQVNGVIKLIKPIQEISTSFSKREFVVVTNEQYPQSIQLELHGDRVDIIDSFTEGQEVECFINLRGRAWTNPQGEEKFFNTIVCWKIQLPKEDSNQSTAPKLDPIPEQKFEPISSANEEEHDDLPF